MKKKAFLDACKRNFKNKNFTDNNKLSANHPARIDFEEGIRVVKKVARSYGKLTEQY